MLSGDFNPNSGYTTFQGLQATGFILESSVDLIVARAGGGQALATQLAAQTNKVTTVATAADSVKLPPAVPGLEILIINKGANPMQVYGFGTDTIDDIATAVGVSQMQSSFVLYACAAAGAWYTEGLANGFAGGFQTVSQQDAMTARAGGGQALGTPITKMLSRFSVVATGGDSALLPAALPGMEITVLNGTAATSMNIFPATGEAINALGANAAFAAAGATVTIFFCLTAGQWFTK